jgi:Family of unknown function (DUF6399)
MPVDQPTAADSTRQGPFRWPHADVLAALADFANADPSSQRAFAQQAGVPHATFNYWLRHYSPDAADPVDSFFRSPWGESVLRRILCSALVVFALRGACGIRLVSEFLHLAQLDRFVAASRGALHPLLVHLEADLAAFRDCEQPSLAQQMKPRAITLVPDEHFHAQRPCLVAAEPVSGFIAVECYRDRRDADTWTEAIREGTRGMHVEVVQLTSDLARGLLCCAEKGLQVAHCPDLFHGQRDLLRPILLPLNRPIQQAEKDLEKAQRLCERLDGPLDEPRSFKEFVAVVEAVKERMATSQHLEEARGRKEEAVEQVRGVGDDYHPFDRRTGKPLTAEEVGQRLNGHLDRLQEVADEAGLGEKAHGALDKSRAWVQALMGVVAWFWGLANARLEELELSEEQEQAVKEKLLAGRYWEMAAGRARTAEERNRLKEMAEELKREAWRKGGALSRLPEEGRVEVEAIARESAGLFQRSSSCVEGRNGRLSLQHHGHSRVSERRLKALTVLHNYMVKGSDGTTAAQRFFGQQHKDLFSWLLDRLPELPRPAQKRSQPAAQAVPVPG